MTFYGILFHLDITEGPESVIALVGTDAQFHCAGNGSLLNWLVDGLPPPTDSRVMQYFAAGFIQSNFTIPATLENNGTSVQCVISSFSSLPVISDPATLTVLPGLVLFFNLSANILQLLLIM